jgi:hypothetical protein
LPVRRRRAEPSAARNRRPPGLVVAEREGAGGRDATLTLDKPRALRYLATDSSIADGFQTDHDFFDLVPGSLAGGA